MEEDSQKTIPMNLLVVGLVAVVIVLISMVTCRPAWVSDDNDFLRGFINHEFLNVLGVILAITLASLPQAHLHLVRIEEQRQRECFRETRREIKNSAIWLIGLFILAFVVVIGKPLAFRTQTETAIANAVAIGILTMYVLILFDITVAVFELKPDLSDDRSSTRQCRTGQSIRKHESDEGRTDSASQ